MMSRFRIATLICAAAAYVAWCIVFPLHSWDTYFELGQPEEEYDATFDNVLIRSHSIWYDKLKKTSDSKAKGIYELWKHFRHVRLPITTNDRTVDDAVIRGLRSLSRQQFHCIKIFNGDLIPPERKNSWVEEVSSSTSKVEPLHCIGIGHDNDHPVALPKDTPKVIVFVEQDTEGFHALQFYSVYQYYDRVIVSYQHMLRHDPKAIVVYSIPTFDQNTDIELAQLHHQIVLKFLIEKLGLLVIQPNCHSCTNVLEYVYPELYRQLFLIHNYLERQGEKGQTVSYLFHEEEKEEEEEDQGRRGEGRGREGRTEHAVHVLNLLAGHFDEFRSNNEVLSWKDSIQQTCHMAISSFDSRKYYPDGCTPAIYKPLPILITGLGGSGTHYVTNELRKYGYNFYHEDISSQGAVSWFYAVNDWVANTTYPFGGGFQTSFYRPRYTPYTSFTVIHTITHHTPFIIHTIHTITHHTDDTHETHTLPLIHTIHTRFERIIHVVRSPMKQISAFTAHTNKSYAFTEAHFRFMLLHGQADYVGGKEQQVCGI